MHVDALEITNIPEVCEFQGAQQEPGWGGYMVGIDQVLSAK